jgi:Tat protein translocase TatB subunit
MIGIGWLEMLVIGVVALIVIGPKELPSLMQKMGRAIGTIRRMGQEFQREINRSTGLDTITDIRKSITEPLKRRDRARVQQDDAIGRHAALGADEAGRPQGRERGEGNPRRGGDAPDTGGRVARDSRCAGAGGGRGGSPAA